jgi:hypothetical protein
MAQRVTLVSATGQDLLYARYVHRESTETLAAIYGIRAGTMNRRITSALWRMVDRLGDPRPIFSRGRLDRMLMRPRT